MSNTIIIELCQEDRQRLDEIIAGLAKIAGAAAAEAAPLIAEAVATVAAAAEHPVEEPPAEPEPVEEPEQPKYTKEEVQAKVQKLAKPGNPKREQAKAIVKSYAAKVSDIPEDKFPEVMAKLAELEG